jgi:hypothetical protein
MNKKKVIHNVKGQNLMSQRRHFKESETKLKKKKNYQCVCVRTYFLYNNSCTELLEFETHTRRKRKEKPNKDKWLWNFSVSTT